MLRRLTLPLIFPLIFVVALSANAARVGKPAPDFTGMDTHGVIHNLSDYRGKFVVLEWTNRDCPYTKAQYDSGNMQLLQKEWTAKGVIWLTILSSAPGQQGYMTETDEDEWITTEHAAPTAAILDPTGTIGHAYEAKTTPNMFVIDPSGKLIYGGAIDNNPTTDPSIVHASKNYVSAALTQAMAGNSVASAYTRPYGCSVKYASASD